MSCTVYMVNCNFVTRATCLLKLTMYKYSELQVSVATQKLSCKANYKTPLFLIMNLAPQSYCSFKWHVNIKLCCQVLHAQACNLLGFAMLVAFILFTPSYPFKSRLPNPMAFVCIRRMNFRIVELRDWIDFAFSLQDSNTWPTMLVISSSFNSIFVTREENVLPPYEIRKKN